MLCAALFMGHVEHCAQRGADVAITAMRGTGRWWPCAPAHTFTADGLCGI